MKMFQMKEKYKIPEELSEMEIGNLSEKGFRVVIIKVMKELEGRKNAL